MSAKKNVSEQLDEVRRELFMSLAPLYLITSGYTMQAALRNANAGQTMSFFTLIIISVAFMAITVWLVVVAFFVRPGKLQFWTYEIFTGIGIIAAIIFVIGWLGTIKMLLDSGVGELYATAYLIIGLLLYFAILAFNIFGAFKQVRRRIRKPASRND